MFDRLEDLLIRYEEIMNELNEPSVVNDQARFQKLMKEQSELAPIVEAYREYKKCNETVEESLSLLEEETDGNEGDAEGRALRRQKTDRGAGA